MGIDVYLHWKGQTRDESPGYLRESYHGGPYVTPYFVAEAFEADEREGVRIASIPASVLRERLSAAVLLAEYRHYVVYGEGQNPGHLELPAGVTLEEGLAAVAGKMCAHLAASRNGRGWANCRPLHIRTARASKTKDRGERSSRMGSSLRRFRRARRVERS